MYVTGYDCTTTICKLDGNTPRFKSKGDIEMTATTATSFGSSANDFSVHCNLH